MATLSSKLHEKIKVPLKYLNHQIEPKIIEIIEIYLNPQNITLKLFKNYLKAQKFENHQINLKII